MDTERKVAWVVGAGSGMGRASAVALAATGWRVVLSGRRQHALDDTSNLVTAAGGEALTMPFDIRADDAEPLVLEALARWGRLDGLVLSAGLNSPRRTWNDHEAADIAAIVQTNLTGTMRAVDAALPALRRTAGVVVVISSYAGWTFQPSAGVAYGASKTALGTVVRSLNTQESTTGVRACHLCPGDVDSDFLQMRPIPPGEEARAAMLSPADVARAVEWIMNAPPHVRIDELVISPVSQT